MELPSLFYTTLLFFTILYIPHRLFFTVLSPLVFFLNYFITTFVLFELFYHHICCCSLFYHHFCSFFHYFTPHLTFFSLSYCITAIFWDFPRYLILVPLCPFFTILYHICCCSLFYHHFCSFLTILSPHLLFFTVFSRHLTFFSRCHTTFVFFSLSITTFGIFLTTTFCTTFGNFLSILYTTIKKKSRCFRASSLYHVCFSLTILCDDWNFSP